MHTPLVVGQILYDSCEMYDDEDGQYEEVEQLKYLYCEENGLCVHCCLAVELQCLYGAITFCESCSKRREEDKKRKG